jgi:hypothetical protein
MQISKNLGDDIITDNMPDNPKTTYVVLGQHTPCPPFKGDRGRVVHAAPMLANQEGGKEEMRESGIPGSKIPLTWPIWCTQQGKQGKIKNELYNVPSCQDGQKKPERSRAKQSVGGNLGNNQPAPERNPGRQLPPVTQPKTNWESSSSTVEAYSRQTYGSR